jgi:hypothetical protein
VQEAAAYVEQARLVYDCARYDHEHALDVAIAFELALAT